MESQAHLQGSGAWRFRLFSAVTLLVVISAAIVLTSDLPDVARRICSGLCLAGVGLTAAVSCRFRARQSQGRRRRAFTFWALACVTAAVGNLGLMVQGQAIDRNSATLSDITLVLTMALAAAGVVTFPNAKRRGTDLVRMTLDGVVIGGSVLAVVSVHVLPQVGELTPATIVGLVSPVIDLVLATLATLLFLRSERGGRLPLLGTAVAFGFYATSDLLYALALTRDGIFQLGTLIDAGWIIGYALIALSLRSSGGRQDSASTDGQSRESSAVLGTATVFSVFLVAGLLSILDGGRDRMGTPTLILWALVLLAVLGRQFFLVLDNEQLRRTLEQRVVERTRSLRQVTRRSELLINSVGDGIYGVDDQGLVTFVNPAAAEVLGHQPHELIGRDAHATFHADASPGVPFPSEQCYIEEAIRDGIVTNAEDDTYVSADGRPVPVEVTATPLTDDGVTRGAVVVFRDVTQRREVDRLKGEFVSMVSHELRTPLTAIRGSLGLLAGGALGPLAPQASRMIEIALVSSERLTRLINEILDLERMDAGALPMELAEHQAGALIDAATAQALVLAEQAGVRLRVLQTEGLVRADADRVIQTLLNLLGNAIKFSETGGEVTVQSVRRGSLVEFEVSDHGRGIPEDKLDAVFTRFQQVDSSDAREKGGSGLGLAISRSIVERLGGRIWAANNPAGGAVFRFTLPAAGAGTGPGPLLPVVPQDREPSLVGNGEPARSR